MKPVVSIVEHQAGRDEAYVKAAWVAFQAADRERTKRGLELGQELYQLREKYSARGRRTDLVSDETTFESTCDRLAIPRATAYRWIARYEESEGLRRPMPVVGEVVDVAAEQGFEHEGALPVRTPRQQQLIESAKRGMIDVLSLAGGLSSGLERLALVKITAACDSVEIDIWAAKADEVAGAFRRFAKNLRAQQALSGRRHHERQ
jgi:hypothetical protein